VARRLSARERQIIELVTVGLTTKQIATVLRIAPSTVDWHIANAIAKLHASNRTEAVAIVLRAGDLASAPVGPLRGAATWMAGHWRSAAAAILVAVAFPLLVASDVRRVEPEGPSTTPAATLAPGSAAPLIGPGGAPLRTLTPAVTQPPASATVGPSAPPGSATAAPAPVLTAAPAPVVTTIPTATSLPLPTISSLPSATLPAAPSLAPSLAPPATLPALVSPLPTVAPPTVPLPTIGTPALPTIPPAPSLPPSLP
jgi:DNA-binding CsgD family transcriptional regulator